MEDLTGLAVAGASLLDEATAVAEAVAIAVKHGPRGVQRVAIDEGLHPQVRAVVQTRAEPVGIEIVEFDPAQGLVEGELSGVVLAYPASAGQIVDPRAVLSEAKDRGALVVMDADPLALTLLRSPGRSAQTLLSDPCSDTASRWPSVAHTPATSRCDRVWSVHCRADWWGSAWTRTDGRRIAWPCKRANSTSAGRRRPATFARRRSCWPRAGQHVCGVSRA